MEPRTNPLLKPKAQDFGPDKLDDHVEKLNAMSWVRNSGFLYFVAERQDPAGKITRYVERNDRGTAH